MAALVQWSFSFDYRITDRALRRMLGNKESQAFYWRVIAHSCPVGCSKYVET